MYFGERNHSFSRKPDPEKDSLREQNALLKELLQRQQEASARARGVSKRTWLLAAGILLGAIVVSGTAIFGARYLHSHTNAQSSVADPVPLKVRQSVGFNVYFPDPAKLPVGYRLDTGSFSSGNGAVVYKINHGNARALVVTVQPKLTDAELRQFYKVHLPLTIPTKTSVGTAELGTLNNETVVSLSTNTNAWLLMTAPLNANQKELGQVMKAMTLAQ